MTSGGTIWRAAWAIAAAALVLLAQAGEASAQERYRRGLIGGPMPSGVIDGFGLGSFLAGVARPHYIPRTGEKVDPPVRCWWRREETWNGYDYVPVRVRVCQ